MKKMLKTSSYAVIAAAMVACGGGGSGDNNAVSATACSDATTFCFYSPSVADGAALGQKFASTFPGGSGQNIAPALEIKNIPAGAQYISIVMDDETPPCSAGTGACIHAGYFDLPTTKLSISEGENLGSISGVILGQTNGSNGYEGPFPPVGTTHTYKMTVYAHKTSWAVYAPPHPAVSRAEVLADHGSSGDNDIVDSKTITFTYVGR